MNGKITLKGVVDGEEMRRHDERFRVACMRNDVYALNAVICELTPLSAQILASQYMASCCERGANDAIGLLSLYYDYWTPEYIDLILMLYEEGNYDAIFILVKPLFVSLVFSRVVVRDLDCARFIYSLYPRHIDVNYAGNHAFFCACVEGNVAAMKYLRTLDENICLARKTPNYEEMVRIMVRNGHEAAIKLLYCG